MQVGFNDFASPKKRDKYICKFYYTNHLKNYFLMRKSMPEFVLNISKVCFTLILFTCFLSFKTVFGTIPVSDPVSAYNLSWTSTFPWSQVISINDVSGKTWNEKLENAQQILLEKGGGVVYFPVGSYHFSDHIKLKSGIIIRGANPINTEKINPVVPEDIPQAFTDAREPRYTLGTVFFFPEYIPVFQGEGTSINTAFKGIYMEDPYQTVRTGVVNIHLINGHIALGTPEALRQNHIKGKIEGNVIIYGNILYHTAVANKTFPRDFQKPWQRWTDRNYGAITVFANKSILVANNRIPDHDNSSFLMKDYVVYPDKNAWQNKKSLVEFDVWFDYQNRTGIRVNFLPMLPELSIWDKHDDLQKAVEEGDVYDLITPGTLAKGIVIQNNYVFSTGGGGIKTTGDGAYVGFNVIRSKPNVVLPTANGIFMDAHVNDVRAIEMRGWRWTVEGNDYEVHSNYTPDGIKFNDGEGIMHESWENAGIRDSKIIHNVGNQYICIWRVPVRGLEIKHNRLRVRPNWHSIFVNSQERRAGPVFIDQVFENVIIQHNITQGGGIKTTGKNNGEGNIISNNRNVLKGESQILNETSSRMEQNINYD